MAERGERREEEWISASAISLRDLVGPEHLLREAAQRRRVGSSDGQRDAASLDALAPDATRGAGSISQGRAAAAAGLGTASRTPLGVRAAATAPQNARVRAYRMYLVKHIGIMTCAPLPSRLPLAATAADWLPPRAGRWCTRSSCRATGWLRRSTARKPRRCPSA